HGRGGHAVGGHRRLDHPASVPRGIAFPPRRRAPRHRGADGEPAAGRHRPRAGALHRLSPARAHSRSQPAMTLTLENVSKRLGGLDVVNAVSFSVPLTSLNGIIGPNGAGKSTLFAVISGFQDADGGEISFAGTPLGGLRAEQRARLGLARTFQVPRPFSHLT